MRFVRYIYRNINPLNIILVISAVLIALGAFSPYFYTQVRYNLPTAKLPPAEEEKSPETAVASPSMSDYMVIAEQNLFHPDRKIPPEKKEAQQLPKPELILYGTLITDGMSVAYVDDKKNPKTSPGRDFTGLFDIGIGFHQPDRLAGCGRVIGFGVLLALDHAGLSGYGSGTFSQKPRRGE